MSITITGKVVVFDYGEVISIVPSKADRAQLLQIAGVPPTRAGQFWEAYWRHRAALDQATVTASQYWRLIGGDIGASWDTAQLHRMWLCDFRSWLAIDPGTLEVLVDLQHGGTRMALLSNAGLDFASYYRHGLLGDFFEQVFVSGELGVLKPEPQIYQALIDGLNVAAQDIVFIDNRAENILGAQALGISGHIYSGAGELRDHLEALADHPYVSASGAALPSRSLSG